MDEQPDTRKTVGQVMAVAADIAGAGIGLTLGGVPGAIAGASAGAILKSVGSDMLSRALSSKEKQRVSNVVDLAERRIARRLQQGDQPRSDGFFQSNLNDRSAAAEIVEGVLITAQREYEERKLPFIAHLMANISFDVRIDRGYANALIRLSERLSYRQLQLIRIFADSGSYHLREENYREANVGMGINLIQVLTETIQMDQLGLLNCSGSALLGPTDIAPSSMRVEGVGAFLHDLMNLWELNQGDLQEVAAILA